jgi:polyketide biosynthesis 3-hydroxy-3-methylglutaryl-CoA synthase-like enzyme PksG
MTPVGIEAFHVYAGIASLNARVLAEHRQLDLRRFGNLMMDEKTVALPSEDPVSFAVNAAKPIVDALTPSGKRSIELLITCTESGIDFGKSISTYVHDYLGLNRNCRVFELKQACYSGTAGFQMAANFVLSQSSPGARALVIAVDVCRFLMAGQAAVVKEQDWAFAEPSGGAGAVAMLISDSPRLFRLDVGASGCVSYEVMDTCRPEPDSEAGNPDLSLMSYLDCCQQSFLHYRERVDGVDYRDTFQYLAFHTPFGGMVKGTHRSMMRQFSSLTPSEIEADFEQRVALGLTYCRRVGNIMGGALFLSLAGIIGNGSFETPKRVGCFSYGSGCCSEFYSGTVTAEGQAQAPGFHVERQLDARYPLSIPEYESMLSVGAAVRFGARNVDIDCPITARITNSKEHRPKLFLRSIRDFHRKYEFI